MQRGAGAGCAASVFHMLARVRHYSRSRLRRWIVTEKVGIPSDNDPKSRGTDRLERLPLQRHRAKLSATVNMLAASREGLFLYVSPNSAVRSGTARRPEQQPSLMLLTHRPCLRSPSADRSQAHYQQHLIIGKHIGELAGAANGRASFWAPASRHRSMDWSRGDGAGPPSQQQRPSLCREQNGAGVVVAAKEDDMAYRKTVYDHGDWNRHRSNGRHSRHMMAIATSRVVAGLLPPVLKLTVVASVVVLFNMLVTASLLSWAPGVLHVSSLPFQLAAPALALLLVFRTNASYGRFDEARKAWASIVNRSRDMARQAVTFLRHPADAAKLHDLLRYLVAFPYCLKDHLSREDDLHKELREIFKLVAEEADRNAILSSPHRPSYVLQTMTQIIHNSHLTDMQKALLDSNVTSLHDCVGGCERIFTTPIPLSYTRLTSRILVIWHLLLPFALWDQCTWVTIPATFLSAAALFCIEEVGVLIEEPFSILALSSISDTITSNVDTILQQHKEISERPRFLKSE